MEVASYRDLKVWQKAMNLVEAIYRITADFPREELYGLVSQVNRAAVSIPSNVAEGSSRRSTKEYLRFVRISLGSIAELETQIELAKRLKYITEQQQQGLVPMLNEVGRMLNGLDRALGDKVKQDSLDSKLQTLNSSNH